jgi:signal transduction histidine kinase
VLFISTFAAATELQRELVRIFEVRAQALDTALSLQQTISVALGVVAIVTTVVVGWVVQRQRRLAAALARAVDEERRLREQAERREEELKRVTESRARLMRGFTHDVKNPLGAADGYLQLLEDGIVDELTEKQRASVAKARRSIGSALGLIEDLLELARAEAGRIDVRHEAVDLPTVLRDVAEAFRAQAEAKGLALAVEVEEGLPTIGSDADRIRQVVGNLLSNAVKYTERGEVTVRSGVRTGGQAPGPGRWIAVEVIDTGPGIPRDQQRLLFQEFARLATGGATRGAGIGLAISRRIARALDGDITVESEAGRGSTFTLWLPLTAEEQETEARAAD